MLVYYLCVLPVQSFSVSSSSACKQNHMERIKYELTVCSLSKYILWKGGILGIFLVLHSNHQGSLKRKKSHACACPKL